MSTPHNYYTTSARNFSHAAYSVNKARVAHLSSLYTRPFDIRIPCTCDIRAVPTAPSESRSLPLQPADAIRKRIPIRPSLFTILISTQRHLYPYLIPDHACSPARTHTSFVSLSRPISFTEEGMGLPLSFAAAGSEPTCGFLSSPISLSYNSHVFANNSN